AAAGPLRQVPLGQSLQSPGDPLDEPGLVVGVGRLAEDLGVPRSQLLDSHPLQRGDLAIDAQVHGVLLSPSLKNGQPSWTLSTVSSGTSRPSGRDSGRFFGPKCSTGAAGDTRGAWRRRTPAARRRATWRSRSSGARGAGASSGRMSPPRERPSATFASDG